MKANKIVYSRLISKGNYENAKIEIELEVEAGERASEVFEAAKKWVEKLMLNICTSPLLLQIPCYRQWGMFSTKAD